MRTAYVSLPITGYDLDERIKAAEAARIRLLAEGWAVYSPLHKSSVPLDSSRETHMKEDIKLLLKADAIYMCKDWHKSKGCRLEYQIAEQCGLKKLYELKSDKKFYG